MQIASVMAEETKPDASAEAPPGAPIPKDHIDPELVKLARTKGPRIGIVTAAGIVFLCVFFLVKLNADRRFSGNDDTPRTVGVADIVAGNVDDESFISLDAEPLMAHAVRVGVDKKSVGLRVVPIRSSADKLWVVLEGDGWAPPSKGPYVGRLRELRDVKFASVLTDWVANHPRPLFATAAAARMGFASSKVATVSGEQVTLSDADRVGFEIVDPNAAIIVCTFNERLPDMAAWKAALDKAGIAATGVALPQQPAQKGVAPTMSREQVRFEVQMSNAVTSIPPLLEKAELWAAHVDPVTRHYETTWGALKASGPAGFTAQGVTIPDTQLDLIGLYVVRAVPSGAYALMLGERPQDYWYVLPVTIVVALLGLLFIWALVRGIKRDLLTPRTPAAA